MNPAHRSTGILQSLPLDAAPGLNAYCRDWLRNVEIPSHAGARFDLEVEARSGPAWADEDFGAWLFNEHERMGASASSLANVDMLRKGAPCVITGQQPALLSGPLYCAWKIAGAVGLARALSLRWGRPVVPVYWCGADDSDFEEARSAWIEDSNHRLARLQIASRAHRPGMMVGDIPGREILPLEAAARAALPGGPAWEEAFWGGGAPEELDLGRRVQAMMLRLFSWAGLVTVDARSQRLRKMGLPLFEAYAQRHKEVEAAVAGRGERLDAAGYGVPLPRPAVRSGLFELVEGRRVKLGPDELDGLRPGREELAPSVLLRPLWQDALLAPVAAVLGPSELLYHAQLKPAYELLGVTGAAIAARPHLSCLPGGLPWPEDLEQQRDLLAGAEASRRVLAGLAMPEAWKRGFGKLRREISLSVAGFEEELGEELVQEKGVGRALVKIGAEVVRLGEALEKEALKRYPPAGESWERIVEFLAPRGASQERVFSVINGWKWWGKDFPGLLQALAERYAADAETGRPPLYLSRRAKEG